MASHDMETITNDLKTFFDPLGLEIHPFQIGWYNDAVSEHFKLGFEPNTIAFAIISAPSMFEDAFIPYLKRNKDEKFSEMGVVSHDPLDSCMRYLFQQAASKISSQHVEIIQDFEILPNKRPKILVQTAAHVAGAAYYYQRNDAESSHSKGCLFHINSGCSEKVQDSAGKPLNKTKGDFQSLRKIQDVDRNKAHCDNMMQPQDENNSDIVTSQACVCVDPWGSNKRIYGVCIHPKYGGWFAIRGVLIVSSLQIDIPRQSPVDCVKTRESRVELLNRFNGNWQDWTFRDIIPVTKKYSELQKKYFATHPKDRYKLISEMIDS